MKICAIKSSKYNQYGSRPKQLCNSTNFSEVDPSWMKSPAWKYFLRNKKDGLAKCKNCLRILKMGQSTSPLIKHLKSHNIDLKVPKYLDLLFNPILHHSNPRVVSMSDFCTLLAWPHFFPRLPWNFLMLLKQPHLRALSNGCMVSSCLASLCFKSRDKCLWAELVTSSNGVE